MIQELSAFAESANANRDVQRIVKNWNVDVIVECSGTDESWRLQVRDGRIGSVEHTERHDEPVHAAESVRLVARRDILQGLFSGKLNPVHAATHGALEVYGKMADQTRLDAVALVLWGP